MSPCGFAAYSLDEAKYLSAEVTKVTHNHPEGMKGAEAALERAGYVGITVLPGVLTDHKGEKTEEPVHVWVKEDDLVPDFSSFDRHERKA